MIINFNAVFFTKQLVVLMNTYHKFKHIKTKEWLLITKKFVFFLFFYSKSDFKFRTYIVIPREFYKISLKNIHSTLQFKHNGSK